MHFYFFFGLWIVQWKIIEFNFFYGEIIVNDLLKLKIILQIFHMRFEPYVLQGKMSNFYH